MVSAKSKTHFICAKMDFVIKFKQLDFAMPFFFCVKNFYISIQCHEYVKSSKELPGISIYAASLINKKEEAL